ncbi:unnamed protein product [Effrenium voratum]|uniref:Uncharacterized protein n=1 Tax=Effrenium voratum TaxID=2562239 RepID=A0AA36HP99_9DINO|nr:unnamed protein product [Effrenium voratum]
MKQGKKDLQQLQGEMKEKEGHCLQLTQERDSCRAEANQCREDQVKQLALCSAQAKDLQKRRDEIEEMTSEGSERAAWVCRQEQELQSCRGEIERLTSEGLESAAVVLQKEQEVETLCGELAEKEAATVRLQEELDSCRSQADQLRASESQHLILCSERAKELRSCRGEIEQLKSKAAEASVAVSMAWNALCQERDQFRLEADQLLATEAMRFVLISQRTEELLRQRKETEQLRADQAQSGSFCARLAEEKQSCNRGETKGLSVLALDLRSVHFCGVTGGDWQAVKTLRTLFVVYAVLRFHITSNVPDADGDSYQQVFPVWTIAVTKNQRQLAAATSDNRINLWPAA